MYFVWFTVSNFSKTFGFWLVVYMGVDYLMIGKIHHIRIGGIPNFRTSLTGRDASRVQDFKNRVKIQVRTQKISCP